MAQGVKIQISTKRYDTCPSDGCVIVDANHADHLRAIKLYWHNDGYCVTQYAGEGIRLHTFILVVLEGRVISAGQVVYHINDYKYDNRVENLEITTHAHNSAAVSKKTETSTSLFKGVVFDKNKWQAKISFNKTSTHLGYFDLETDAAEAYDRAFIAIHGSINGSNMLLSNNDVIGILADRDSLLPQPKRQDRPLPKFISMHDNGFRVRIIAKGTKIRKTFGALHDATLFLDAQLKLIEENKEREIRSKPIERNVDGIAIIGVKICKTTDIVFAKVDDDDYYALVRYTWFLCGGYALSSIGRMHKYLCPLQTEDRRMIDHKNGDKLDNRRNNLRAVTASFNSRNCKRKREDSSSQYPGVSWYKKRQLWEASYRLKGKRQSLGFFVKEDDAAKAYRNLFQELETAEHVNGNVQSRNLTKA